MQAKTFVLTAIAAVVTSVAALVTHAWTNQFSEPPTSGAKLVGPLATGNAKVGSIVISRGADTLTLEAKGDKGDIWAIKERGGFPADPDRVRALLVKLAQSELIEGKTRNADRLSLLEVEDPGLEAKSRTLRVLDQKGGVIADLIVGKRRVDAFGSGRSGTYVRRAGETQAWLASGDIEPSASLLSWIKPAVVALDSSKIDDLTLTVGSEPPLIAKRAEGKVAFTEFPPEGRKLKDASAGEALMRSAASIDLEDVRQAANPLLGAPAGTIFMTSAAGPTYKLTLRKDGDAHWMTAAASGTGDAKAAADAFNARAAAWDFKLSSGKAEQLLKTRSDLLEPEKAG